MEKGERIKMKWLNRKIHQIKVNVNFYWFPEKRNKNTYFLWISYIKQTSVNTFNGLRIVFNFAFSAWMVMLAGTCVCRWVYLYVYDRLYRWSILFAFYTILGNHWAKDTYHLKCNSFASRIKTLIAREVTTNQMSECVLFQ